MQVEEVTSSPRPLGPPPGEVGITAGGPGEAAPEGEIGLTSGGEVELTQPQPESAGTDLLVDWEAWGERAESLRQRAVDIFAAYNCFFEHIGLRKGWRTAPFEKDDVQVPFKAAADVVSIVRDWLDDANGGGVILRQLEGASMDFMWGWPPGQPVAEALKDFFRGLVFATLSDARGLVEGLDAASVEHYLQWHPLHACCGGSADNTVVAECGADGGSGGTGDGASGCGTAMVLSPSVVLALPPS